MSTSTRNPRLPSAGDAAFVGLTLAFCEVLYATLLGRHVPPRVALLTCLAEGAIGAVVLSAAFAAMTRLQLVRRLARPARTRMAALVSSIPLCAGAAWITDLFKVRDLPRTMGAWVLLMVAGVGLLALVPRRAPAPQPGRGFRGRLLLYALLVLGSLVAIHRIAGSVGEERHPRALVGCWGVGSILLAAVFLRNGIDPGGERRRGLRHLAWGGAYLGSLALVGIGRFEPRTESPWKGGLDSPATGSGRPNVLLVSIDTLRADHLHCYGYDRDTSPTIDRLASEGVLLERDVSAAPWTLPSHSALFTSRYPGDLAAFRVDGQDSMATLLHAAGYRTAAFTAGRFVDQDHFGEGFDFYCDDYEVDYGYGLSPIFLWTALLARRGLRFHDLGFAPLNVLNRWRHDRAGCIQSYGGPWRSAAAAANFIRTFADDGPFFLFYHTFVVHEYYLGLARMRAEADRWLPDYGGWLRGGNLRYGSKVPARGDDLAYLKALYDGSIRIADGVLGALLEALEASGHTDDTLVVLTSDHGEGFRPDLGRTWHRGRLHDDLLHVPLILRMPGSLPPGVRREAQVSAVDVLPTVLELVGLTPPPAIRGSSLLPLLEPASGTPGGSRALAFSQMAEYFPMGRGSSLRSERFKYIVREGGGREFYDLAVDPQEVENLAGSHPSVPDFDAATRRILRTLGAQAVGPARETHEMLNALGYLQDGAPAEEGDR